MAVLKEYKLTRQIEQHITTYKSCSPVSVGLDKDGDVAITLSVNEDSGIAQYKISVVFPGGTIPKGATHVGALPKGEGNAHVYFNFNTIDSSNNGDSNERGKSSTISFG